MQPAEPSYTPPFSEPEPDYAICKSEALRGYDANPLPEDIFLLIEVSDTTLEYDRTIKSVLYAMAGIPEYWIINLQQNQVEVHLEPDTEGGTFNNIRRYALDAELHSPFRGTLYVADLIP